MYSNQVLQNGNLYYRCYFLLYARYTVADKYLLNERMISLKNSKMKENVSAHKKFLN